MPVEFPTDEEAAAYGAYQGAPCQAEMEKLFFLDAVDKRLVARRRGDHNRLGFAMQLTTVRYLDLFLPDPLAVPGEVVGYLAGQLKIADPDCVGRYVERRNTKFEHAEEIKAEFGLHDSEEREKELRDWLDARAWTTGDGPKAIFADAMRWLRGHDVLLPGVTTLAGLVAQVRDDANQRLWETLHNLLRAGQRALLDSLTKVPEGERVSQLEKWRKGPVKASGRTMEKALDRVSQIRGPGFGGRLMAPPPRPRFGGEHHVWFCPGSPARRRRPGAVRGGGGARLVPIRACPAERPGPGPSGESGAADSHRRPAWNRGSGGCAVCQRSGPRPGSCCRCAGTGIRAACRRRAARLAAGASWPGICRCCSSSQFPGAVTATHCSRRWPAGSNSIATASRLRWQAGDVPGRRPPRRRHMGCAMCFCKPIAKSPRPTR